MTVDNIRSREEEKEGERRKVSSISYLWSNTNSYCWYYRVVIIECQPYFGKLSLAALLRRSRRKRNVSTPKELLRAPPRRDVMTISSQKGPLDSYSIGIEVYQPRQGHLTSNEEPANNQGNKHDPSLITIHIRSHYLGKTLSSMFGRKS